MATMLTEIPTDPRERVLRVPRIGPDRRTEMCTLAELEPETRARLKAEHLSRIAHAQFNRAQIRKKAKDNPAAQRMFLAMSKKDIVFWLDSFVMTYDDRLDQPVVDFILYPRQRELARYYQNEFTRGKGRQTLFIEKSRGIGFSWVMAACIVWSWLFREGYSCLLGAVLLDDIDNGGQGATLNCHMGRMRYIIDRLPEWMRPVGIESEVYNKKLLLSNPEKVNNTITGRQMGPNLGRMGRFSEVFLDEIAHTDSFDEAIASVGQTTRRIVMGTTPKGRDTASARMRFSGQSMKIMLIHWTSNPMLDVEWYWGERSDPTMTPEKAASELDISYDLSAANRIFRTFDPAVNIADLDYDPHLPLHVAIDPGADDECSIHWIQPCRLDKTYRIVDSVCYRGKYGSWFVPMLLGHFPPVDIQTGLPWNMDDYDDQARAIVALHGTWNPIDEAYGGDDGNAKTQVVDYSLFNLWYAYGVAKVFGGILGVKHGDKLESIRRAEIAMPRVRIARRIAEQRTQTSLTPTIVEAFQQYTWEDRAKPGGGTSGKARPKHDIYSHPMDAWQIYLAGKEEDVVDPIVTDLGPGLRRLFAGITDATGNTGSFVPEYDDPISRRG